MKSAIVIISLLFNLIAFGQNEEVLKLSGKFVIKKGIEGQDTDLYFKIKDRKGKSYAYPVRISEKKLNQTVRSNLQKIYIIEAIAKQRNIRVNETSKFVNFLDIKTVNSFELKSLGITSEESSQRDPDIPYYDRENPANSRGGYRLSDKAANSIIFAAGAAILGAIIAK